MYSPEKPQKRIDKYPGILLGKHPTKDEFLFSYGQTFVDLAAEPGSGKTVGFVIPNLLTYPDSMIVNDPKFECWGVTAGFRAASGHKVYRFSPELLETHRWNPLSTIRRDPLYRLGDARTIASSLYVADNPKNQEWYSKAAAVFTAIVLYLLESPELPCTLPQVYEVTALGTGMGKWVERVIAERSVDRPLSSECVRELTSISEQSKSKGGGWGTTSDIVRSQLTMYSEKTVAWAVSGDDIQFDKMREEKTTVYFCASEDTLEKYGPLMSLFYAQAIRQNSKGQPENGGHCPDGSLRLKYQVWALMDEFAIMGRIKVMETAPAVTRGAGLRYGIIYQNRHQLRADDVYGKKADAILGAFHIQIIYTPKDNAEAKDYSERLGNTTVKVNSGSVSHGEKNRTKSTSWSMQPRALMLPQEIMQLPYDEQLMFIGGTRKNKGLKVRCRKVFWYEEPELLERANWETPAVPTGNVALIDSMTVPVVLPEQTVELADPHDKKLMSEALASLAKKAAHQ